MADTIIKRYELQIIIVNYDGDSLAKDEPAHLEVNETTYYSDFVIRDFIEKLLLH